MTDAHRQMTRVLELGEPADPATRRADTARWIALVDAVTSAELGDLVVVDQETTRSREESRERPPSRAGAVVREAARLRRPSLDDEQVRRLLVRAADPAYEDAVDDERRASDLAIAAAAEREAPSADTLAALGHVLRSMADHLTPSVVASACLLATPHVPPIPDEFQASPSPFRRALLAELPVLSPSVQRAFSRLDLVRSPGDWLHATRLDETWDDGLQTDLDDVLAHDPEYLAFADRLLQRAEQRLAALHDGSIPFAADRLVEPDDAVEIARAAGALLGADSEGAGERTAALLEGAAIAPTTAKSAPSQKLAYALGQQIARVPTPEAITGAQAALGRVRHAGVAKKLDRQIRSAGKALQNRGAIALRTGAAGKLTPARLRLFTRALEGQLALGTTWAIDAWRDRLFSTPQLAKVASALVWVLQRPDGTTRTFLGGPDVAVDVDGSRVDIDDGTVGLWHPVVADDAERAAWRRRIWAGTVTQPFRQVFREHYRVADPAAVHVPDLAGVTVDVKPFLGLARSEGWGLRTGTTLERPFDRATAVVELAGDVYPGAEGHVDVRSARIRVGRTDTAPADLPPALVSEILRAVDLLVSVTAIELATLRPDDGPNRDATAFDAVAVRRIVAEHVYAGDPRVRIEARRVHVGDTEVHLGTASVRRHGDPVELDAPAVRRTFVPASEPMLSLVLDRVDALLSRV